MSRRSHLTDLLLLCSLGLSLIAAGCGGCNTDVTIRDPGPADGGGQMSCAVLECGGLCCAEGEVCESGLCVTACDGVRCGDACCAAGSVCEAGQCEPDCGQSARCGPATARVCCAAGDVCEDGQCRLPCAGARCGATDELCCVGGSLCLYDKCLLTYGPCTKTEDCDLDEFCDPQIGACIKAGEVGAMCTYVPPVGQFTPTVAWHWSGSTQHASFNQVMETPAIANLTDDNGDGVIDEKDVPDVVFGTFSAGGYNSAGVLRIISGDDGRELASDNTLDYSAVANMAIAHLDGDGVPEIVTANYLNASPRKLYAVNLVPDGNGGFTLTKKWEAVIPASIGGAGAVAPALADLDSDGIAEVVSAFGVHDGRDGVERCNGGSTWTVPAVADLDGDGKMEIVANGRIYDAQCQELASFTTGTVAIADVAPDQLGVADDLKPEIAVVHGAHLSGTVELWNVRRDSSGAWTTEQVWARTIPINRARIQSLYGIDCDTTTALPKACNTGGGPPTIADFDGDGQPDVGTAARWYYLTLKGDGTVLWAHGGTKDFSSGVTGSSVFDFDGDGIAEVVYADEELLRVYSGPGTGSDADGDGFSDAQVIFDLPNPSGTLFEYPLVVDVDNDGRSNIVVISNNYAFPGATGVRAFGDTLGNWVRTRRIWNQHTYHVTNVSEAGELPTTEPANWLASGLNNYRQQVEPASAFNAPNLVVEKVEFDTGPCPTNVGLVVTVKNVGALGIPAGTWVSLYATTAPGGPALITRAQVPVKLFPGQSTKVTHAWNFSATSAGGMPILVTPPVTVEATVDDPPPGIGGNNGTVNECVESDNKGSASLDACTGIG